MNVLFQDVRFALRQLRKAPGFTAVAMLTLALGIGCNTTIFSLVSGILLSPLPYSKPEQLVSVTGDFPRGAFVAMREQIHTMDVAAYAEGHDFNLTGQGEPVRLTGTLVSVELFSILGMRPALGRTFDPGEDIAGQDNYVILSHDLWEQRFGSDATIIGRSIELEGVDRQVIGVMAADFQFPSTKTQLWIPLHNDPRNTQAYWATDFMPVIGRLRSGSTLAQARAEIRLFQSHVPALFPWQMPASWNADVSVVWLRNGIAADIRPRLLLLLGVVTLVLMIGCANVANLILSRSATREKEMAIRSALGAVRQRIVRQLLTESVLLALLGGLLGLVFAASGLSFLKAAMPADTPRLVDVRMDWRVLAFTGGITILTGLIFGLAPAIQTSRGAFSDSLKSGRGAVISVSQRLRSSLAVAEVAFAALLVISAGLLIRSFWTLSHVNPGFQSEQILTARISPNESFCNDTTRCLTFYRSVLDQVQTSPGVRGAALVNTLPLGGRVAKRSLDVEDYVVPPAQTSPLFWLNVVSPEYFRVMGIALLSGSGFTQADDAGDPPRAVVTAATAKRYWPGQNAVGKHIRFVGENDWRTVVGVIADVRAYDLQRNVPDFIEGTVYVPFSPKATMENRHVPAEMTIAIRTTLDQAKTEATLRRVVTSLNHEVPVSEVETMATVVSEAASTPASTTSLFGAFAGLALVLAMVGIYGVLSFLVARRTREIGIRIALGAQRRDVLWLIMKEGAKFSLGGIAIGWAGAFVVTRLLSSELYGVSASDPATYVGVAVMMGLATLLACYVPTRRAMRVDPMTALRYE
jgi:predicted permease